MSSCADVFLLFTACQGFTLSQLRWSKPISLTYISYEETYNERKNFKEEFCSDIGGPGR